MSTVVQTIDLPDLPVDLLVEGYYWYSDQTRPELVRGTPIDPAWFTALPFVIEANFYAREANISFQVRHQDGRYRATRYDLHQADPDRCDRQRYVGHDLHGHDFEVLQGWEPFADPLLENMETLVPTWCAFIGFVNRRP